MRKLVFGIIALIALFSAIRAYTQAPAAGIRLQPGLVEIGDGGASLGLSFGVMEGGGDSGGLWNILPLRLVYRSGDKVVSLGLNGLSFLMRQGVSAGTPVLVERPRSGDVISVGGKVTVDSRIEGDVWTLGADVSLLPRAEVSGNVVAIGGKVSAEARASVKGSVIQLPQLKVPFLGVFGSRFSAHALALAREILGYALFGAALFVAFFYLGAHSRGLFRSVPATWRQSLLTVLLAAVLVPLLAALLVASIVGIFFLPFLVLALALLAIDGFLALCARLGAWLRRASTKGSEGDALFLFTSGLLGLFMVKAPALVGIVLGLFSSALAARIGEILRLFSLGLTAVGMLYGVGAALAYARSKAAG